MNMKPEFKRLKNWENDLNVCIRCGYCYELCHPFQMSNWEADTPRGKLILLYGMLRGDIEPTEDIASSLGKMKTKRQFLAGFALETDQEITHAKEKLQKKNFDFIVLNSLKDKGAGFKVDTNKITIIDRNNKIIPFELKTKKEVAHDIVSYLADFLL